RQIVSEERVHVLACNWRLQRLFAFELRRWEAIEAGRGWLGFLLRPRAKMGRGGGTNISRRAAKSSVTSALCAKVDDASSARETPHPSRTCAESDRPKTPSSGQLGSREPKEPRTLRKSFVPAQCRGPYYKSSYAPSRTSEQAPRLPTITAVTI